MSTPAATKEVLSAEEFHTALRALSKADQTRLVMIAGWWTQWTPFDHAGEDLLNEAVGRALEGKRQCPRNIDVVRFLDQAMRSIRSDWMEKWSREHGLAPQDGGSGEDDPRFNSPDAGPTPEDELCAKQSADEILGRFEGAARKVLEGQLAGLQGAELQKWSGLDETAYASTRRMINRRLKQLKRAHSSSRRAESK